MDTIAVSLMFTFNRYFPLEYYLMKITGYSIYVNNFEQVFCLFLR